MKEIELEHISDDSVVNLVYDTIVKNKQIIIFVNSKKSAESLASKISSELKKRLEPSEEQLNLAGNVENVLENPTEQCKKLAKCLKQGVAFHHSGLLSKQRELIETGFKENLVRAIVATPTLAAGVNLPAFRILIKNLYRYDGYMKPIPVLEFHQMAGRAGRPGLEKFGQAIAYASSEEVIDDIFNQYIYGDIEDVDSKLGVEAVLRSNILGLATRINSVDSIMHFLSKTLYAHQFQDMNALRDKILNSLENLKKQGFVEFGSTSGFSTADSFGNDSISITEKGRRVAELYLDPDTGQKILAFLSRNKKEPFLFFFEIAEVSELHPIFRVSQKEAEDYINDLLAIEQFPDSDSLEKAKFARVFSDWISEKSEEYILENYNIRPGELRSKITILDWLIYSATELAKLENPSLIQWLTELRYRVQFGVKRELLPLITLKHIGRVRSRLLYNSGIVNVDQLLSKKALARKLLGKNYDRVLKENNLEKKKNYDLLGSD